MKTYILYQNGKLTVKEKEDNKKKISNFTKKSVQSVQSAPIQSQYILPQKMRSHKAPPYVEPLKNINQKYLQPQSQPQSQQQSQQQNQSGGKKMKMNELQIQLFTKICKIINIDSSNPIGKVIPFDTLNDDNVIRQLYDIQDKLKDAFPSSKLTALHTNAMKKQSFPGVNIVRQIYKEMGYKLTPVNISEGYVGNKKILRREYHIKKL
jgi:hypothetical protein